MLKIKVKRLNILRSNIREIDDYLSLMAEKGFFLEKIIFSDYYIFKRDNPEKIHYFIDYYKTNNYDDLNEYFKLRYFQGYSLVCSKGDKHIFKGNSNDIHIQRDSDSNVLMKKHILESYIFTNCSLLFVLPSLSAWPIKCYIQGDFNATIYTSIFLLLVAILSIIKFREYLMVQKSLKGNDLNRKIIITNTETIILLIVIYMIYGMFR